MVPVLIRALACIFLTAAAAKAALDLTPQDVTEKMEAMTVHRIAFHDSGKEIYYQPPKGWTCFGSHTSAALTIPAHQAAHAYINEAAHLRIPAIDDKSAKLFYQTPGLLQLPKGATNAKINSVVLNPLVVDGHPTLEVMVTYNFFGINCARSILIINRNGEEVSCILDCLAPDFDLLHKMFSRSFYTFENL